MAVTITRARAGPGDTFPRDRREQESGMKSQTGRVRLKTLAEQIRACTKCPLHESRTHAVPGEGNPAARVMLIGEAPGRDEDLQGRPFVGAAGRFLDHV